jgi:DNA-binding CsgD family transcriptional regulator
MSRRAKSRCYNFVDMSNVEFKDLSERERDILKLVATGASNKEIAQRLFISSNTVKVHLRNIFTKIGANSRTEAAMYAVRIGLTETISYNLTKITDYPELQGSTITPHSGTNGLSNIIHNKLYVRFLGLLSLVIILIITGLIYLRQNDILAFSQVSPTATQRVQWYILPGLPTPRSGLAVVNYENGIYAIGGENSKGISDLVESYNPQTNSWTEFAPKTTPVTDIEGAVIGGLIYIPGGRLENGVPTDIMEIYDPKADKWSLGSPLPKPVSAYALAVFEGRMYLFGGWDGKQVVNQAYIYDYHNDTWSVITPMPTPRSYAGAVVVGGKIYIIGGWDGAQALSVNEVFLPDNSEIASPWIHAPALPYGRYGMGITNLADIIFIIGGLGSNDNPPTIALSSGDTSWGQLPSPISNGWTFLGATTVGTRLYVLGGKDGETLTTEMWSYQAIFTITLPIIR